MIFSAKVIVNTKPNIKDIKALTLKQAVENILPINNFLCSVGNVYSLAFEAPDEIEAQSLVQTIAQEILANQVIEDYEIFIDHD